MSDPAEKDPTQEHTMPPQPAPTTAPIGTTPGPARAGLSPKEAAGIADREEEEKAERRKEAEKAAKTADKADREGAPGLVESLTDQRTGEVHDSRTLHGEKNAVSDIAQAHFATDAEGRPLNPAAAEAHAASMEAAAEAEKERAAQLRKDAEERDRERKGEARRAEKAAKAKK